MQVSSQPKPRTGIPAHWRQVSFICFDLGVLNVIGGIGVGLFYSLPLHAVGFAGSSLSLGMFFILIGLAAYKIQRLPAIVPIVIIIADVLNTVLFLPKFDLAGGVVLVKISFLVPVILVFISMLRTSLNLRTPKPEEFSTVTMRSEKEVFALLSSMFVSVGAGITALLLFVHYVMPLLTESTNPLINIFHDFVLVPALLLLFPLGAAAGELIWLQASRLYLSVNELALFIRYLKQFPLISRLAPKLTEPNQSRFDDNSFAYEPSFEQRRPWRKYAVIMSVLVLSGVSLVMLVRGVVVPTASGGAVSNEAYVPTAGTIVVSQTKQGDYSNITDAVANAAPGSTIVVRAGLYREAVVIDKDITIVGEKAAGQTRIECGEDGCLRITAPRATIKNLTIDARVGLLFRILNYRQRTAAVRITNGRSVIEECDITSNNGVGIVVSGEASAPEIRDVKVHDCMLNGILFTKKSTGLVENSYGFKNKWAAIRVDSGGSPVIRRSRFYGGKMDGLLVDYAATATVEDCELFDNNLSGIQVREGSSAVIRQTRTFRNAESGISIHDRSFGEVESCDVYENGDSGIKVASKSGSKIINSKVHHQKVAGLVVWYDSTSEIEGATVYENATGLWVASGGKPIVRKSVFRSQVKTAIDVNAGGEPLIEHTQIYGGKRTGIYFREGGHGVVNECAIFGNAMSNIIIASGSDPQIRKTRLSDSSYAGVLVTEGGQGSITECEIFNNYLGVEVRDNSTFTVEDCKINNNRHQGFMIDGTSEGSIKGSKLTGNADGAWKIAEGARIMRERNTE